MEIVKRMELNGTRLCQCQLSSVAHSGVTDARGKTDAQYTSTGATAAGALALTAAA